MHTYEGISFLIIARAENPWGSGGIYCMFCSKNVLFEKKDGTTSNDLHYELTVESMFPVPLSLRMTAADTICPDTLQCPQILSKLNLHSETIHNIYPNENYLP